eukprot:1444505-Pyramimonas_sp.AAC.1
MKTWSHGGTRALSRVDYSCSCLLGEVVRPIVPVPGINDWVEPKVSRDVPRTVGGTAGDKAVLLESP